MISMARKDNKGRNLKTGESQRPDGRYMYRYKDELTGKRVTIYDMDLASLREQEKKLNKDIDDQLITNTYVKKLTVNGLFERYMETKNIREKTKTDAGIRTIPMTQTVYDAFRKQKELNLMFGLQSNVEIGRRSGLYSM